MSGLAQQGWVLSPLDGQAHLLAPGEGPWGWRLARCGHMLSSWAHQHQRPPASARRRCWECVAIAARPFAFVPWTGSRHDGPRSMIPAGAVPLWAHCPVTKQMHLLNLEAVRRLTVLGCAVAACGVVITIRDVASGDSGPSCPTCLLRRTSP